MKNLEELLEDVETLTLKIEEVLEEDEMQKDTLKTISDDINSSKNLAIRLIDECKDIAEQNNIKFKFEVNEYLHVDDSDDSDEITWSISLNSMHNFSSNKLTELTDKADEVVKLLSACCNNAKTLNTVFEISTDLVNKSFRT